MKLSDQKHRCYYSNFCLKILQYKFRLELALLKDIFYLEPNCFKFPDITFEKDQHRIIPAPNSEMINRTL